MALPQVSESKPTAKRVAAYLIDSMISHGLKLEIDSLERSYDVELTDKQRKEVIRHHEAYVERIRKMIDKA